MSDSGDVIIIDSHHGNYVDDADIETQVLGDMVSSVRIIRVESHQELAGQLDNAVGVLVWHHVHVSDELLQHLPRCKGIIRTGVGFDNIDIEATARYAIPVANIPDYGTEEVADHTMALLLAAVRRLPTTGQHVRDGGWAWDTIGKAGRMRGRKLGIIGFGRIGRAVSLRARPFGLQIGFYDPHVPSGTDKAHGVHRYKTLEPLLAECDYIAVHAFLNEGSRGMIGSAQFAQMKNDAILINTARGGIVERAAMIEAVENQRIGMLGLDVVDGEPDIPEAVRRSERVILTPHSAFYSQEGMHELRLKAAQHMRSFLLGEPVLDVINGVQSGATR